MKFESDSLFAAMMAPCLQLMSKIGLRTKLLGMFLSILSVCLLLGLILLAKENAQTTTAENELYSIELAQKNNAIIHAIQRLRSSTSPNEIRPQQQSLKTAISDFSLLLKRDDRLDLVEQWQILAKDLQNIAEHKNLQEAKGLLTSNVDQQLVQLADNINERSGLLFDPEANSYLLMDFGLQKLPVWLDALSKLSATTQTALQANANDPLHFAKINSLFDQTQVAIQQSEKSYAAILRTGEKEIPAYKDALQLSRQALEFIQKNYLVNLQSEAQNKIKQATDLALGKTYLLQTQSQTQLSQILQQRQKHLRWQSYLVIIGLLITLILTAYLSFGFYLNLMYAVENLEQAAETVASGDLTTSVQVQGSDELAKTSSAIDKANFNLSALVANVRTNASMVSDLGKQLSSGINDMAIRTELQALSLVDTAQNMETLSETVKTNAANAKSVDNLASNVRMIAESSSDTMRAAVSTMQGIHTSAMKVHEIVSMIDKIAFQTDILALNAAVEASHAGEQGKGFAVVANEVRNLAQRSADAARQIRRLIDDSVNRVETGVEQIYEVNETLSDIVGGIRNLAKDINAISTASTEQSNSLIHISQAIRELDEITKSNSKMAENAKFASSELEVRAEKLTSVVSAFRLRQGTADEAKLLVNKAKTLFSIHGMHVLDIITSDPEKIFADRDMYVFAFDRQGQYRAFAGNAGKLSVNLFHVPGLDGRKLVEDAFALPEIGGWVDYSIENPVLNRIEQKTSYIERISDDIVIGCGVYKSA
ncbi:methyl-accepting chemotaxis protein [Undibacterium fentianense]|uniref:HAMP domain-containing protein n=1 Tax=Undibacterium fentianense TaxID=2828728 RepID=A0A941E1B3_9BURK|nr:methyl-accepting chemotaxis protein [Undibacterium fentianense]MBR7801414.1 HAMP domain-containing protein [Undibacterium fentianense]